MPQGFRSFAEVLEFALGREEESISFYENLVEKTEDPLMKMIFKDFLKEEMHHRKRLENIDIEGGLASLFISAGNPVNDLKIAETFEDVEPSPEMDFRKTLVVAMKREEKSSQLYSLLAEMTEDEELSLLFVGLATEELRHKHRVEEVYEDLYGV